MSCPVRLLWWQVGLYGICLIADDLVVIMLTHLLSSRYWKYHYGMCVLLFFAPEYQLVLRLDHITSIRVMICGDVRSGGFMFFFLFGENLWWFFLHMYFWRWTMSTQNWPYCNWTVVIWMVYWFNRVNRKVIY